MNSNNPKDSAQESGLTDLTINGHQIGLGHKPYVIAELSACHNGNFDSAIRLIEIAQEAGADAVKIQTYTPDTITLDCDRPEFFIKGCLWDGQSLYQLYKDAHTPWEWHEHLFAKAKSLGITLFSSPFDNSAVDLLEGLNAPAYKIASFELVDLPLISRVAQSGKPMIMSTGIANLQEIQEAVETAQTHGCTDLVLLHCISAYPSSIDQANLLTIKDLSERFDCIVGLSDHTMGTVVSIAAVASGAAVIEKHVTLSREDKGPDSAFSLEPNELRSLCKDTKDAWLALGEAGYARKESEEENAAFRRSIYFVKDLSKGDTVTKEDIRRIRPGFGLAPKYYDQIVGKKAKVDIERGTASCWDLLESD